MDRPPIPADGGVVVGRDVAGRSLRVTPHPEHGLVVLSIWDGAVCRATIRLAPADVDALVAVLTAAAVTSAA